MDHYVYIVTDSNRTYLHAGVTIDLENAVNTYKNLPDLFFGVYSKVPRLVYYEKVHSEAEALYRLNTLTTFTRMQKEKLIRRYNPNWINLTFPGGEAACRLNDLLPTRHSLLHNLQEQPRFSSLGSV